ncbi:MAG: response regulator [Tepidisphaeraceae bacterium]
MNASKPPTPEEVRVLIVDDEGRLREVLTRAITSWGFQVASARSGEEALRLMHASKFDVSIVDLDLPGISGIELFEKLRAIHPEHQVIVLTGFGNLEAARAAIRLDVVDFLEKPCPLGELEKSLHRATQRLVRPMPQPLEAAAEETQGPESVQKLEDVEREHIISALRRNDGNRTATAIELGISRRTLQYKLSEYQRQGFAVDE